MRRRSQVAIRSKGVIAMAKDPICGMEVSEAHAAATLEYRGQKFCFCAASCYEAFKKNPDDYFPRKKEGWWNRFLNRLAQANRETYGDKTPKCH